MRTPGFTFLLLMSVGFLAPFCAWGETIELVTYYPAPGGGNVDTDRLHANRATIGNPPYSITNPANLPNGTLLVAGPVGIGTENPGTALHVNAVNHGLLLTDPGLPNRRVLLGTNQGGNAVFLELSQDTTQYNARTWQLDIFPDNRFAIVQPGQLDRVTVLPNGNVGIGTVAPQTALHVNAVNHGMRITDPNVPNRRVLLGTNQGGDAVFLELSQDTTQYEARTWEMCIFPDNRFAIVQPGQLDRVTVLPNGNVGIGNFAPQTRLDVAQGSAIRLGGAYVSSGQPQYALFSQNAWYDGGIWRVPDPAHRSATMAMSGGSIFFYQTQTAGGTNWQPRFFIDVNGVTNVNWALVQNSRDNVDVKAALGTGSTSRFIIQRDAANGYVYLYYWNGTEHRRIRLGTTADEEPY